ncbi:hypothetical protein NHQ30_002569 [Ciborinia camelliae]|nr:hypothetical protein NHQ30_002569 [Ciborinia camelliae]
MREVDRARSTDRISWHAKPKGGSDLTVEQAKENAMVTTCSCVLKPQQVVDQGANNVSKGLNYPISTAFALKGFTVAKTLVKLPEDSKRMRTLL